MTRNWCSLNAAWMRARWCSGRIKKQKNKLKSHPDSGKNNKQEIRQSASENRGFNRDNGRTTEPERDGPFPVVTPQNWGTICHECTAETNRVQLQQARTPGHKNVNIYCCFWILHWKQESIQKIHRNYTIIYGFTEAVNTYRITIYKKIYFTEI